MNNVLLQYESIKKVKIMKKFIVMLCVSMITALCSAQDLRVSVYQPVYVERSNTTSYAIGLLEGRTPSLDDDILSVTPKAEPKVQTITKTAYYITEKGDFSKINIQITIDPYGVHLSAVYNRSLKTWQKQSHPIYEVTKGDKDFIYNNFEYKSYAIGFGTIYF